MDVEWHEFNPNQPQETGPTDTILGWYKANRIHVGKWYQGWWFDCCLGTVGCPKPDRGVITHWAPMVRPDPPQAPVVVVPDQPAIDLVFGPWSQIWDHVQRVGVTPTAAAVAAGGVAHMSRLVDLKNLGRGLTVLLVPGWEAGADPQRLSNLLHRKRAVVRYATREVLRLPPAYPRV
jgi:hypothetical protein